MSTATQQSLDRSESRLAVAPQSTSSNLQPAPRGPRGLVQNVAYGLDGFMISQLSKLKPRDLKEAPVLLDELRRFTASPDFERYVSDPEQLFPEPGPVKISKRWLMPHRIGFSEWRWTSVHPIMFRDVEPDYRSRIDNLTARLRLLKLRVKGSPVAILVNGFSSGHHLMERVAWPMREFDRRGIGVALYALPFHGPRGHSFPPEWPHQDTAFTVEGFRQAIWDLRVAIRGLREAGASHVGVVGMSLGGYTASLLATVTSDLDFMISYIPIASLPDVMFENDLVPGAGENQEVLYRGYRQQLVPITPVYREPMIGPERIRVISGELDRLATMKHGARLSNHFGAKHITYPGAHLLQYKRRGAFRKALDELAAAGVIPK